MTIKLRGRLFWTFAAISAAGLIMAVLAIWMLGTSNLERVRTYDFGSLNTRAFYTVLSAAAACGIFSATVSGLIAFKSGKTVSVEIFFFALWALCQGFELVKFGSLALSSAGAGLDTFEIVTRAALFGRYAGTIAIFAGSLFSVGLKQERGLPVLAVTLLSGLLFASIHPLNSVGPGPDFLADRGLVSLARAFELAVIIMALLNYAIAYRASRDKAHLQAGLGLTLCVSASVVLRVSASPWVVAIAVPVLGLGAWVYLKSMHEYYLWR
ncbi:MAG: hypothetical protein RBT62_02710 [Spirochaetia bacterium]|jgi:hypothetical protein|nr:hypothetical protein [Spirochaetia bacterium]